MTRRPGSISKQPGETHSGDLNSKSRRYRTEFRREIFPCTAAIGQSLRHLRMRFMNLAPKHHSPVATPDVGGMNLADSSVASSFATT